MKRILLASASIVAFAGAAAADHVNEDTADGVSLSGSAELGFNDEIENGFFVEGDLGFTLARELNNGLLAAVTFGLGFEDDDDEDDTGEGIFGDDDLEADDFIISLTDRTGSNGLHFGDTMFAAERHWFGTTDASGLSIPDAYDGLMASDDFSEQDDETAIRGDMTFGTFNASVSYLVADAEGDTPEDDIEQLSLGASGVIGGFTTNLAYQEESDELLAARADAEDDPDFDEDEEDFSAGGRFDEDEDDDLSGDEVFGVSAGSTFAGADVRLAYATNRTDDTSSLGASAQFPAGPVTVSGFYTLEMADNEDDPATDVDESDPEDSYGVAVGFAGDNFGVSVGYENEQGDDDTFIDASFQATPELEILAGYSRDEEGYVAAEYDLGNGASAYASFAETDENDPDEKYREGTTVALELEF